MNTIKVRINYILSVKLYKIILWRSFFLLFGYDTPSKNNHLATGSKSKIKLQINS